MKNLKILVFIETYHYSGPAKVVLETLSDAKKNIESRFIAFLRGSMEESDYIDRLKSFNLDYGVIRENFRFDPSILGKIRKEVNLYQPDIIEVHNIKSGIALELLKKLNLIPRIPIVHTMHGETWSNKKQLLYNKVYRKALKKVDSIVVVCNKHRDQLISYGIDGKKITVMPNAIKEFSTPDNVNFDSMVTVGRLSKEKGHRYLLEALALLKKKEVLLKLTIVGDGPEMTSLKKMSHELCLEELVEFVGHQTDVRPYFSSSKIFVLPSLSEGMPLVLFEAAMFKNAIISTSVGGVPDIFENDKNALLCLPEKSEELAKKIESLAGDPDLQKNLGAEAFNRVSQNFTTPHRVLRLHNYYTSLFNMKERPHG